MQKILRLTRAVFLVSWVLWGVTAPAQPISDTPPLPPPTDEQLQKGRALLDKILYIVKNVPMSKPSAVFRVFGSDQVGVYPRKDPKKSPDLTHVGITSYDKAIREKWKEIGIRSVEILYPFDKTTDMDHLYLSFIPDEACVSYHDVRRLFWPISTRVSNPILGGGISTQPMRTPPPVHEYRAMVIELERIVPEHQTLLHFSFDYQTCAVAAGVENVLNIAKETQ